VSLPLRLIDPPPYQDPPVLRDGRLWCRVYDDGDCWPATRGEDGRWYAYADGPEDLRHPLTIAPEHADATPVLVALPGDSRPHCLHAPTLGSGGWGPSGWQVSGELPRLTVSPSIHVVGVWHGWLRDGVLVPA